MTPTYHKGQRNYGTGYDMMARIDELEAACWRMQEERDRAIGWRDSDKDRADRAEARLALMLQGAAKYTAEVEVEAVIRIAASLFPGGYDNNHALLCAALAELKGGKDD